jgi:hypothetical protein
MVLQLIPTFSFKKNPSLLFLVGHAIAKNGGPHE